MEIDDRRVARRHRTSIIAIAVAMVVSGLWWPSAATAVSNVPVTYMGHIYASAKAPSADKPQSKLWYHDGSWWALLVEAGGTRVVIHQLLADHTWESTGTLVDGRAESTGDALWSAPHNRLYVASRAPAGNLQVNAFTYDPTGRSWAPVPGFPVTVDSGGTSESATIDQDTTGRLWVTYTRAAKVWVAHSDTGGGNWSAGFTPTGPGADTAIASDDLSALVAFNGKIGLLYSDQTSGEIGAFRLATHQDGAPTTDWSFESFSLGERFADDHINLKQLVGDPQGRIFAAIKTSNGDVSTDPQNAPLVGVLSYTPGAANPWAFAEAGTVADDHTRPLIMIDKDNQELYFFATAPVQGGDIFYKKAPLANVDFADQPGRGTPFIDAPTVVNNATGAKEPVTEASGLVLVAVNHGRKQYVHAEMALGDAPADTTAPTVTSHSPGAAATGVAVGADVTATFSEDVLGVGGSTFSLRTTSGSTAVSAGVTYDAAAKVATLNPDADLAAGTQYTATLTGGTGGIRDAAGNSLSPNPTTWSFTTAASVGTPPTVTARTPAVGATGVSLGVNITATFNEKVLGVDGNTFTLTNQATGAKVSGALTSNTAGTKWTLNPGVNLAKDARYTVTLTGGPGAIRDTANTPFASESWEFLTGPRPKVSSRTPAVNATGVPRTANVTATFSEPVQGVDVTTFVLKTAAGAGVSATVSRNGTTNQWILDPGAPLAANTQYTVTITTGVQDLAGNALASNVVWSFTTS